MRWVQIQAHARRFKFKPWPRARPSSCPRTAQSRCLRRGGRGMPLGGTGWSWPSSPCTPCLTVKQGKGQQERVTPWQWEAGRSMWWDRMVNTFLPHIPNTKLGSKGWRRMPHTCSPHPHTTPAPAGPPPNPPLQRYAPSASTLAPHHISPGIADATPHPSADALRTCACPVVQVDVCDLHTGRQCRRIHREVVVLCADLDAACACSGATATAVGTARDTGGVSAVVQGHTPLTSL